MNYMPTFEQGCSKRVDRFLSKQHYSFRPTFLIKANKFGNITSLTKHRKIKEVLKSLEFPTSNEMIKKILIRYIIGKNLEISIWRIGDDKTNCYFSLYLKAR